jgi:hypothetical protein
MARDIFVIPSKLFVCVLFDIPETRGGWVGGCGCACACVCVCVCVCARARACVCVCVCVCGTVIYSFS